MSSKKMYMSREIVRCYPDMHVKSVEGTLDAITCYKKSTHDKPKHVDLYAYYMLYHNIPFSTAGSISFNFIGDAINIC